MQDWNLWNFVPFINLCLVGFPEVNEISYLISQFQNVIIPQRNSVKCSWLCKCIMYPLSRRFGVSNLQFWIQHWSHDRTTSVATIQMAEEVTRLNNLPSIANISHSADSYKQTCSATAFCLVQLMVFLLSYFTFLQCSWRFTNQQLFLIISFIIRQHRLAGMLPKSVIDLYLVVCGLRKGCQFQNWKQSTIANFRFVKI